MNIDSRVCVTGWLVLLYLTVGCTRPYPVQGEEERPDAAQSERDAGISRDKPEVDIVIGREPNLEPSRDHVEVWHPSIHPPGTVLRDDEDELWIVTSWLERAHVRDRDFLFEIGVESHASVLRMTNEEERCLPVRDGAQWRPPNESWQAVYGPHEDEHLYLLDWEAMTRRRASPEVLESWGYDPDWLDQYDGRMSVWRAFEDIDSVLPFRDGTLIRTEDGVHFMYDGLAHPFIPEMLAEQAGYAERTFVEMMHERLEDLVRFGEVLTRESFTRCPADGLLSERNDRDGDGAPFHRDCDDFNPERFPEAVELCDGSDQDCDGLIDEDC